MAPNNRYTVGLSTFVLHTEPLPEALEKIYAGGVRHVELFGEGSHVDPRVLQIPFDLVRDLCRAASLIPDVVHAPFHGLHLDSSNEVDRQEAVSTINSSIDLASEIGAGVVIIHPSGKELNQKDADARKNAIKTFERSLGELARHAQEKGVRLALENMPGEKDGWFGSRMSELVELADRIGLQNVGFCLDTGHAAVNRLSPMDEARAAGDRLFALHASDNDGNQDLHLSPGRGTGEGSINWPQFFRVLDEINYRGIFMLELMPGQEYGRAVDRIQEWLAPVQA